MPQIGHAGSMSKKAWQLGLLHAAQMLMFCVIAATALMAWRLPTFSCGLDLLHLQGDVMKSALAATPASPLGVCTELTFSEESLAPQATPSSSDTAAVNTAAVAAASSNAARVTSAAAAGRRLLSVESDSAASAAATAAASSAALSSQQQKPAPAAGEFKATGRRLPQWIRDFTRSHPAVASEPSVVAAHSLPSSGGHDSDADAPPTPAASLVSFFAAPRRRQRAIQTVLSVFATGLTSRPALPPSDPVRIVRARQSVASTCAPVNTTHNNTTTFYPSDVLSPPHVLGLGAAFHHLQVRADVKYYVETTDTGHLDARWFKGNTSLTIHSNDQLRRERLREVFAAWANFARNRNFTYWLAHGTLLGWYWNQQMLPWDDDIDIQTTGHELTTKMLNATRTMYIDEHGHQYYFDVNPNSEIRSDRQRFNVIDARFIDMRDGFMIDITGVSFDPRSRTLQCKSPHSYLPDELFPLYPAEFEGVATWRPNKVHEVLLTEYHEKYRKPQYNNWAFNTTLSQWVQQSSSSGGGGKRTAIRYLHRRVAPLVKNAATEGDW